MRKTPLVTGEYYHVYNRGVDKRSIFQDIHDLQRFLQSAQEFNSIKPIGSLYENRFSKLNPQLGGPTAKLGVGRESREREGAGNAGTEKLVEVVCYCLNPNHYHFLLKQTSDGGVSEFMKRLGGGYTWYFNNKHKRSGALFQGKFRSVHVDTNEYLLHLSAYINLNNQFTKEKSELSQSSWDEYCNSSPSGICQKDLILKQFNNPEEYKKFAESSLEEILAKKKREKELFELFNT